MRIALLLAALAGLAAASAPLAAQQFGLPERETGRASPVEGRFAALGGRLGEFRIACAQCHGMDGLGDPSGAFPRLDGQSPWYLYKSLQDYASGIRYHEVMTPVALQLDDGVMQSVAVYFASQASPGEISGPDYDPGVLQRGGAISAVGIPERGVAACQNCHGPEGRGMAPVYPVLAGQYAPYLAAQLRRWQTGARAGDPLNVMQQIASQMTDEDIRNVSAYFATVRREASAPTPQRQPGALRDERVPSPEGQAQ
jgi:cytochrome c553